MSENNVRGKSVLMLPGGKKRTLSAGDERILFLAFQALHLPNTLSKAEIEMLGLALLIERTSAEPPVAMWS